MDLSLIALELAATSLAAFIILLDFFVKKSKTPLWAAYIAGTILLLGFALLHRPEGSLLKDSFRADGVAWFSKIVIVLCALFAGAISYKSVRVKEKYQGAYLALLLSASLGMMVLVSATELVTFYIGLETSTISLIGLTTLYKHDDFSLEAGIKYLVLAAFSTGILLYGLSLLYSVVGSTYLSAFELKAGLLSSPVFVLGIILVLLALGFKLSIVPMHVWTPDVYQGAPTPVTAFISVSSKFAGFVFVIRLFADVLGYARPLWLPVLLVSAVLTMAIGNFIAVKQKNIKRLLAYSTISQAGYVLVGFAGAPVAGASAMIFYLVAYAITNIAVFAVVIAFSNASGSDELDDYAGLARREPFLALALLLSLLSLAGIPPLAGFIGKIYLFWAAMEGGYLWLVIIAVLFSIVSLYYYLMVLKQVYIFDKTKEYSRIKLSIPMRVVLAATIAGILWLGIFPYPVIDLINSISSSLFAG